MLYNVVSVSAVQYCESTIIIFVYIYPLPLEPPPTPPHPCSLKMDSEIEQVQLLDMDVLSIEGDLEVRILERAAVSRSSLIVSGPGWRTEPRGSWAGSGRESKAGMGRVLTALVSCEWARGAPPGLREAPGVLCVLQSAPSLLPSGKPSARAGPPGPEVKGKQAALLLFTAVEPGKARVVAFHLRKP